MEEYLKPLLMLGVSVAGSAVQGAITKHKTKIDNDRIPVQNGATWGSVGLAYGAHMASSGDPNTMMSAGLTMAAGFAGATVSSLGHKLIGKLFG